MTMFFIWLEVCGGESETLNDKRDHLCIAMNCGFLPCLLQFCGVLSLLRVLHCCKNSAFVCLFAMVVTILVNSC